MKKVVLLTGGSSGIGRCTAAYLAKEGCRVYELSRRAPEELPGVRHIGADVTDEESVVRAVGHVLEREGRIDVLISNAGFGISGAIEFTGLSEAQRQFDVNFFGLVRTVRAVLPVMRKQGGGRIVAVSSVAAVVPIPFQAFYSASKAAIQSYIMALANEVRPFGITALAVMPGDIRTGFTDARKKELAGDEEYGGRIGRSVGRMEHDEQNGMKPETAGRFIGRAALSRGTRPLRTIGFGYKMAVLLTKLLPAAWLNRLIGALYAENGL